MQVSSLPPLSIPSMLMLVDIGETTALVVDDAMAGGILDIDIERSEVSFLVEMIVSNITLR